MSAAAHVLKALSAKYRELADRFQEYGQAQPAALLLKVAEDLETAGTEYLSEPLSVAEAAAESNYSESRLYHLVNEGTVPNAGVSGSPRIRRADLPRKGSRLPDQDPEEGDDFASEILRSRRAG